MSPQESEARALEVRLEPCRADTGFAGPNRPKTGGRIPGKFREARRKLVTRWAEISHSARGNYRRLIVVNSFADLDRVGRENLAGKIVLFNVAFNKRKASKRYARQQGGACRD